MIRRVRAPLLARSAAALLAVAIGSAGAPAVPLVKAAHRCSCPRGRHDCRCPICSARRGDHGGDHRKVEGAAGEPCVDPSCGLPAAPWKPGRLTEPFVLPAGRLAARAPTRRPVPAVRGAERDRPSQPEVPPPRAA